MPMGTPEPTPSPSDAHLFRNLMEHVTDNVYFKDTQSRFLAVSRRLARLFGIEDPAQVVGKTDFDFFSEEHARQAFEDEQEILRGGRPIVAKEEKETWPDGRVTWVSSTKMPLRDERGRIVGTFGISRDITERKRAEEALRERSTAMERELENARSIQRALMPTSVPQHPRLKVQMHYQAMETVGGDFVSFPALGRNAVGFFVGDVVGHGVSAALFMALLKFVTEREIPGYGADPGGYLERLNVLLRNQRPVLFVSSLYGFVDFAAGGPDAVLAVAGAGYPYPLLSRAAGGGGLEPVELVANAALGITDRFETRTVRVPLKRGDRVYLYTDGLTNAANPEGDLLGTERLRELFEGGRRSLEETIQSVRAGVERFRGGGAPSDDMVLIGLEVQ
jgi:sigma-B regulation protein RsbU (phosphoserine phosphatase)